MHGKTEYKGLSIILVDVMREREMAPDEEAVSLVFTPEGYVLNADESFRSKIRKEKVATS